MALVPWLLKVRCVRSLVLTSVVGLGPANVLFLETMTVWAKSLEKIGSFTRVTMLWFVLDALIRAMDVVSLLNPVTPPPI